MRISDKAAARLKELGVELRPGVSLAEQTSLGIGGTTDEILLRRYEIDSGSDAPARERTRPAPISRRRHKRADRRWRAALGGAASAEVEAGDARGRQCGAYVDASADLGGMVTFCAKHDLGGMEGLIGVPGSVGGALRMNAGAYGTQIGPHVREVELYRAASGRD